MTDELPVTLQTARYLTSVDNDVLMTPNERQRQQQYGICLDYTPMGFYPLEYQGKKYLICPMPRTFTTDMVFPLDITDNPAEATLTLQN